MSQITVYDVAERAGVSISTVSRVLNAPEKVNTATRAGFGRY
jgi:LacI family transcriptional regulator